MVPIDFLSFPAAIDPDEDEYTGIRSATSMRVKTRELGEQNIFLNKM